MLDSDTAILDSDTLLSSLRFTQKHSHSNLTLTQTNSIWLKLIPSHLTSWWQPSWICHLEFNYFAQKKLHLFILTQLDDGSHLEFSILDSTILHKTLTQTQLTNSSFSLNLMMAVFFNLAILDSTILVIPLILTHTCQDWFPPFAQKKLTHICLPTICTKKLHSFILTQLDDGSHL